MPQEDVVTLAPFAIWNAWLAVGERIYKQVLLTGLVTDGVIPDVATPATLKGPPPVGAPKKVVAFSWIVTVAQ